MKILWLASWYPNPFEPVNGDFIQRHARAVSQYTNVDVIHVLQLGAAVTTEDSVTVRTEGNLREFICSFRFVPTGLRLLDKVRYNAAYLRACKKMLLHYEKEHGKPDLVHIHVPIKAGIAGRKVAQRWQIPYIVSEQASYYEDAAPDNFHRRSKYFKRNAAKIFRDATAVTNVSSTIGKKIRDMFGLQDVITVHNLVETKNFHPLREHHNPVFTWLHVSALGEQKNIPGMLQAFAALRNTDIKWGLKIVGPCNAAHLQLASQLGVDDVVSFTGELPYAEVAKAMQQADAFVLFSNHENFPCVVVEALCSGLPVVASDAGGVREAVQADNGIVVPVGDVAALQNAVRNMMAGYDKFDRQSISSAAARAYAAEVIGAQFFSLYEQLVHRKEQ